MGLPHSSSCRPILRVYSRVLRPFGSPGTTRPVTFRPHAFSASRRFAPRWRLRVYCTPQPTSGFTWFQPSRRPQVSITSDGARKWASQYPRRCGSHPSKVSPQTTAALCHHSPCPRDLFIDASASTLRSSRRTHRRLPLHYGSPRSVMAFTSTPLPLLPGRRRLAASSSQELSGADAGLQGLTPSLSTLLPRSIAVSPKPVPSMGFVPLQGLDLRSASIRQSLSTTRDRGRLRSIEPVFQYPS